MLFIFVTAVHVRGSWTAVADGASGQAGSLAPAGRYTLLYTPKPTLRHSEAASINTTALIWPS